MSGPLLPSEIGNLVNMELLLAVEFNKMGSALPSEICNLVNVQTFTINDNVIDSLDFVHCLHQ